MPSVTNLDKFDKSTLPDPNQEPLSKVQLLVDNKIRNLEKRKSRLEQYRDESKAGKELNHDQKKAVKRYEEVNEMLEFFREFKKNVQSIFADHAKQLKKLARKERPARDPKEIERLRLVFLFQDLLGSLSEVKNDFIKGAVQLTDEKIGHLEEFIKTIESEKKADDTKFAKTAERFLALVEGIRSDAIKGASYKELKDTLISISESGYLEKSSTTSQQPQVTEEEELKPNFESSPVQADQGSDTTNLSGSGAPNNYNFLQESRLEMENVPHMDPAVVAMAPVAGGYSAAYNQSVEALAAQFASTGIPPMSSVNNMSNGVANFDNAGPAHQPIPTQTFTNQRFTAMMTGGTFMQPVPISNPPLLGLPLQLSGQTMTSHPSSSNQTSTDNNQSHGTNVANTGQSMPVYGSEANVIDYPSPNQRGNSQNNQRPIPFQRRDKSSFKGNDNANQGVYGSNYSRYRRGAGRGVGERGGDRNSGPPRTNKYSSVNDYNYRGRGVDIDTRSSDKPSRDAKPKNISDNRNVSNQWS